MEDVDSLTRIQEVGFRKVGFWMLANHEPTFRLEAEGSSTGVLYAFVSEREVLYVGKTTRTLQQRIYGYQRPGPTQRTNISGRASILDLLASGKSVDIYALTDTGALRHGNLQINLAAGLEDTLIRELQPRWNKVGR